MEEKSGELLSDGLQVLCSKLEKAEQGELNYPSPQRFDNWLKEYQKFYEKWAENKALNSILKRARKFKW